MSTEPSALDLRRFPWLAIPVTKPVAVGQVFPNCFRVIWYRQDYSPGMHGWSMVTRFVETEERARELVAAPMGIAFKVEAHDLTVLTKGQWRYVASRRRTRARRAA